MDEASKDEKGKLTQEELEIVENAKVNATPNKAQLVAPFQVVDSYVAAEDHAQEEVVDEYLVSQDRGSSFLCYYLFYCMYEILSLNFMIFPNYYGVLAILI